MMDFNNKYVHLKLKYTVFCFYSNHPTVRLSLVYILSVVFLLHNAFVAAQSLFHAVASDNRGLEASIHYSYCTNILIANRNAYGIRCIVINERATNKPNNSVCTTV